MSRVAVPVTAALAAVLLVGLLAYGVLARAEDTSLDEAVRRGERPEAPSRPLPALNGGGTRSLADLRGQVVVLNFWASWCTPCRAEAPVLERAHRRLRGRGGTVLGVTYRDSSPASRAFVREYGLSYPSVRDVDGELAEDFGTRALPETFVIDREGRVAAISRGQVRDSFVDRALRQVR